MGNIFIPQKLKVGFQERKDTYTGKLAYVIYYDQTGKLRKEASWNSWRDNDIEPIEIENKPTSGFVLNKKVGGYQSYYNMRQTYVRVYDPRDFEFEISIPNLLYILENTNSIKGKGLEDEFVYGWNGTDLILIPTSAPEYKEHMEKANKLFSNASLKAKDMEVGYTYYDLNNVGYVYMGRHMQYKTIESSYYDYKKTNYLTRNESYWTKDIDNTWSDDIFYDYVFLNLNSNISAHKYKTEECGKKYWFYCLDDNEKGIVTRSSVPKDKFYVKSESPHENYADFLSVLEHDESYCPIDFSATVKRLCSLEEFIKAAESIEYSSIEKSKYDKYDKNEYINYYCPNSSNKYLRFVHSHINNRECTGYYILKLENGEYIYSHRYYYIDTEKDIIFRTKSIEELFNFVKPYIYEHYLTNGNMFETKGIIK